METSGYTYRAGLDTPNQTRRTEPDSLQSHNQHRDQTERHVDPHRARETRTGELRSSEPTEGDDADN